MVCTLEVHQLEGLPIQVLELLHNLLGVSSRSASCRLWIAMNMSLGRLRPGVRPELLNHMHVTQPFHNSLAFTFYVTMHSLTN